MSNARAKELKQFLADLPDRWTVTLAAALERNRLAMPDDLPHDMLLNGLRPKLKKLRPPRIPTPMRLFCQPFEDLIVIHDRSEKRAGQIARSSIAKIWSWLANDLKPANLTTLCGQLTQHILTDDHDGIRDTSLALYGISATALLNALEGLKPDTKAYRRLADQLGGPMVLEDARDMAMVLEVASDIRDLQHALPYPIETLGDAELQAVCDAYQALSAHMPDHARYILMVVYGRLSRPWEILRVVGKLTNRCDELLASKTDLSECGDLVLSSLEDTAHFVASARPATVDLSDVRDRLIHFTDASSGMTNELGFRRDGPWGQRLMKARAGLAEGMEALVDRLARNIYGTLAITRSGGGTKAKRVAAVKKWPDPDAGERAVAIAAFLDDIRYLAGPAAFSGSFTKIMDELTDHVQEYCTLITDQLRTADEDSRPVVEAYVGIAIRLCVSILGPDDVETLERRMVLARREAGDAG